MRGIPVKLENGCAIFDVRVAPRASRNAIEGEHAGALKVRLTAPPVEGRANDALRRVLAECLNVPVSAVRIVTGESSRTKRVSIAGVSSAQVLALAASKTRDRG
ncbi:MAG: DUF167 domain-containing protein [Candidatus Acidiferrales bacterium]